MAPGNLPQNDSSPPGPPVMRLPVRNESTSSSLGEHSTRSLSAAPLPSQDPSNQTCPSGFSPGVYNLEKPLDGSPSYWMLAHPYQASHGYPLTILQHNSPRYPSQDGYSPSTSPTSHGLICLHQGCGAASPSFQDPAEFQHHFQMWHRQPSHAPSQHFFRGSVPPPTPSQYLPTSASPIQGPLHIDPRMNPAFGTQPQQNRAQLIAQMRAQGMNGGKGMARMVASQQQQQPQQQQPLPQHQQ
ncbi:MAG: hypothetical protein M4579_003543 [Chaenotheca gracillima]|nr:MAG: hypothetical protein M4579_003543 [Chaenotheca gracillima]